MDPESVLLYLLRTALDLPAGYCNLADVSDEEWRRVVDMSFEQGVDAVAVDGYQRCLAGNPGMKVTLESDGMEDVRYDWMGSTFQAEDDYRVYSGKVEGLCRFFSEAGFGPVILKGLGLALDYPEPSHRPVGDIDVFLEGGRSREGDLLVRERLGEKVTKSRLGHHSHFNFRGLGVENHYELSNSYFGGARSQGLERDLRELIARPGERLGDCGGLVPGADFNAVFLIWHMGTHFCSGGILLRHFCDWVMFLKRYHDRIDWLRVRAVWKSAGLERFADAVGSVSAEYFAMPGEWMPGMRPCGKIADRVMEEVFRYGRLWAACGGKRPERGLDIFKYVRAGWKYRLVSGRSSLRPMLHSAWMHIFRSGDLVEKEIC